ncbi:MAG TPA: hypothetical protein VLV31_06805 [Candidatus Acidoferrales bacterium]|nr:hypothetical protein [Candidatus Acidoferrales bacterium]
MVFWFLGIPFGLAWLAAGVGATAGLAVGGLAGYYLARGNYYPAPYGYYPAPYYYQPAYPAYYRY